MIKPTDKQNKFSHSDGQKGTDTHSFNRSILVNMHIFSNWLFPKTWTSKITTPSLQTRGNQKPNLPAIQTSTINKNIELESKTKSVILVEES